MSTLAYVISSHGFGHAARSAAVVDALSARRPDVAIHILTTTPRWFFEQSLSTPFGYHAVPTDLGLVQASSLEEDLDATAARLESLLDDPSQLVDPIARHLEAISPDQVICDISPWGLEAARRLGLPTVLVENFTWDWIYRGYGDPRLDRIADALSPLFIADRHYRLEPFCGELGSAEPIPPVARRPRQDRRALRSALGLSDDASMALVTMGGVPWDFQHIESQLATRRSPHHLVIAGGASQIRHHDRCILIPHRSDFYHPDLVAAADLVVGKLGYSTVAEVAENRKPFLYVPRPRFPESPALEAWVQENLPARPFHPVDLEAKNWLQRLDHALEALSTQASPPPTSPGTTRGAETLAKLLLP